MINNDWKKGMEESQCFIAVIDSNYFDESLCIEQALYAKTLKKPTILIIVKKAKLTIPDLFNNIVLKIDVKDENALIKKQDKILNTIRKLIKKKKI